MRLKKLKKAPYYFIVGLLTIGASLILGLLSFGGMFALWPVLPLALAAFTLSVGYEGEIYLQNIIGALNKLFQPNYLTRQFANQYLHHFFPDVTTEDCPQFFKDYDVQLDLQHRFEHKRLNKESRARQKQVEKTLTDMDKWFSTQLFAKARKPNAFEIELKKMLNGHNILKVKQLADVGTQTNLYVFCQDENQLYFIPPTSKRYTAAELKQWQGIDGVMHCTETAPLFNTSYKNCHVFVEKTQTLYYFNQRGQGKTVPINPHKAIPQTPAFLQKLRAHLYTAELQQWLAGCSLECIATTPKLTQSTFKNRYVFVEKTQELFYFNTEGEGERVTISAKNRAEFVQNVRAVMGDKTVLHLTPAQLKTLTTSAVNQRTLVTLQSDLTRLQQQLHERRFAFSLVRAGSLLAAVFMGFGTTYLLVSTFMIIPVLATLPLAVWPMLITPMAIIAGTAYGLLTFNAITDLIIHDSLRAWYKKLRDDLQQGLNVRNVLMTIAAVCIFTLTIALTICTAGTWWTVVKTTRPLFAWMAKMPAFIMQVINPLVIGVATFGFNIENTAETLTEIDKASRRPFRFSFAALWNSVQDAFSALRAKENTWQILNPFRIILKLTVTPLRILLFIGHLISIGVTSDRLPGVPEVLSALLGIISEGFEDAHYFFDLSGGHEEHKCGDTKSRLDARFGEGHGHDHAQDIPTRVLKSLFYPLYLLAAHWDYKASQLNRHDPLRARLSYQQALEKQMGLKEEENVEFDLKAASPSSDWKKQQSLYILRKQQTKLATAAFNTPIAQKKATALGQLQEEILALDLKKPAALKTAIAGAKQHKIYQTHRVTPTLFSTAESTTTSELLDELPLRTQSPTSVSEALPEHTHTARCAHANSSGASNKPATPSMTGMFCSIIPKGLAKQPILNEYLAGSLMFGG